jgi:hypothetical protein
MGFKKYQGPIETVAQAMMAHLVVTVTCQACRRWTLMWAWRLYQLPGAKHLPLFRPVPGFRCSGCRRRVTAVMMPGMGRGPTIFGEDPEPVDLGPITPRCHCGALAMWAEVDGSYSCDMHRMAPVD